MNLKEMFVRVGNELGERLRSWLNVNGWEWIGDDRHPELFERKTDHGELSAVARLSIDEESARQGRFSDVWVPGAVLIPPRWQDRVAEDIQWYVPRRQMHFGFQTAAGKLVKPLKQLYEHIEADIQIMTGERPLYRIEVEVYYRGECLAMKNAAGLAISIDENMAEADEIAASLVSDAVNAARNTWIYRSMAFSAV